tara:strand:- start:365 stop:1522 length:1158 start_codon:yes stop_codon:yes gene_type:complete
MNWITLINGLPCEDETELRQEIEGLILDPENLERIIPEILSAAEGTLPSELINDWAEREPGVTACLTFERPPEAAPDVSALAAHQEPLDTAIATTAATGLLRGLEDHFIVNGDTGFLLINNENPPTIEQAGEMFGRVMGIAAAAERLEEFGKWQTGSLYDACENTFGENFNITQFVELSDKAYNTIITAVNTYRAFAARRYNRSFTHHKEAFYSNLPADDENRSLMHRLMALSETFQLSCQDQRKLFKYAKNYGIEDIEANVHDVSDLNQDEIDTLIAEEEHAITNREDLVDRVTVRSTTKNYIFRYQERISLHRYQERIFRHRGVLDALPQGATGIICTDDWQEVQRNGNANNIAEWARPGVEIPPPLDGNGRSILEADGPPPF